MKAIGYYVSLPFIYLISILPFPLFYLFSDFIFFIFYHLLGYRKKIVLTNLRNSFPEKSEEEVNAVAKRFYRYLCDLMLETFKTLTISREAARERCRMTEETKQLFASYKEKNQSVIIVMGHFGNWEWGGNSFSLECGQRLYVIYHPLTNKYFDRLIYTMRSRFGTGLIDMNDAFRGMVRNKKDVTATAFIADQTPSADNAHWTTFLNQETPVFKGTEKIAQKMNYPVVYVTISRVKRGYYELSAETLVAEPKLCAEGEISELHTKRLEQDIKKQPEIWLWSHRRWKHKRPEDAPMFTSKTIGKFAVGS